MAWVDKVMPAVVVVGTLLNKIIGADRGADQNRHPDEASIRAAIEAREARAAAEEATTRALRMEEQVQDLERRSARLQEEHQAEVREGREREARIQAESQRRLDAAEGPHREVVAQIERQLRREREETDRVREQARQAEVQADRRLLEEERLRQREAVEAAARLAEALAEAERRAAAAVEEERERAHAETVARWNRLNREYPIPDWLRPFISEVQVDRRAHENQEVRLNMALLGDSGVGKSSLIAAILRQWCLDGNARPQANFEGDGTRAYRLQLAGLAVTVHLWDLPGQGTQMFPAETYLCNMGLKYFDMVLIVTDGRWSEGDARLCDAIRFAQIWFRVVRSKVDQAVEGGMHDTDPPLAQEGVLARIVETLRRQTGLEDASRIHLITTRQAYWRPGHVFGQNPFGQVEPLCELIANHVQNVVRRRGLA